MTEQITERKKCTIVIPVYNEARTIEAVIRAVKDAPLPDGWNKEILVINDGSMDGTDATLQKVEHDVRREVPITVIHKERNEGKGSALKTAFRHVKDGFILIQDADFEYDSRDYLHLLSPLSRGARVVFGSRTLRDNRVPLTALSFHGGLLVSKLFNLAFGTKLSDVATCYKVFHSRHVPQLLKLPSSDFVYDVVELSYALWNAEKNIAEVPISYRPRTKREGKKIGWRHGFGCIEAIVRIRLGIHRPEVPSALRVFKFLIAGSAGALLNIGLLYAFTEYAGIWYLSSAIISFILSSLASFFFHKFWTFEDPRRRAIAFQLPIHLAVSTFNLFLNTFLVFTLVEWADLWYILSQAVASLLIAIESYLVFRKMFNANTADMKISYPSHTKAFREKASR